MPTGPVPHLTLLVVAGQSNAIGSQSYVVDPSTHRDVFAGSGASPADEHVLLTWDESGVTEEHLSPVALGTPQDPPGTQSPIFGPEVGLARSLYAAGRRHLLVVKVCFSGTSLAVDWRVSGDLFARLVSSVRAAQRWASANGWSASVGAVYWVQGETDAEHGDMASTYGANLLRFISSARADLGLNRRTPFVIGRIDISEYVAYKRAHHLCTPSACAQELRWNAEVRDAQAAVARSVQAVRVVDTEALPRVAGQFLHLSDRAELWLGAAFAKDSLNQLT